MDDRAMKILKHLRGIFSGRESGAAFIAVLTFLILGAIIIAPLLGFMITGPRLGCSPTTILVLSPVTTTNTTASRHGTSL
jgi:hypothetical protein